MINIALSTIHDAKTYLPDISLVVSRDQRFLICQYYYFIQRWISSGEDRCSTLTDRTQSEASDTYIRSTSLIGVSSFFYLTIRNHFAAKCFYINYIGSSVYSAFPECLMTFSEAKYCVVLSLVL